MPLYMDFHKGLSVTVEDVKNAHIADEKVQHKYSVKYHQFWVNEEAGTVFCLMEGPDKESCEAVHREAHGDIACSIVEVESGFYKLFMGDGHKIEQGHVVAGDGSVDLGYRSILVIALQSIPALSGLTSPNYFYNRREGRKLVLDKIHEFKGREAKLLSDDSLTGIFNSSMHAVQCALEIRNELLRKRESGNNEWNITFKMGLSAGQPVTENEEFFGEAIKLARRLSNIAYQDQVLISSLVHDLCDIGTISQDASGKLSFRSLNAGEEAFINNLFRITEANLSDENFTIDDLSKNIGISRPQLYRKIVTLTGRSPNDLIRDLRMDKAFSLLKRKTFNISEVALQVGYNNPSYFAKCFSKKYGCTPSRFLENAGV
jgi:AraC-like DNA-binding protein